MNLEWQIHPSTDGLLRYTLVQEDEILGTRICAIYHHAGWRLSLSHGPSEGVLLLSESEKDRELEGVVVASLLALLAQLRMLGPQKTGRGNKGQVKKLVRRSGAMFGHLRL